MSHDDNPVNGVRLRQKRLFQIFLNTTFSIKQVWILIKLPLKFVPRCRRLVIATVIARKSKCPIKLGPNDKPWLRPRQNCHHFVDDIFKHIFLNENVWISLKVWLRIVPKRHISNIPSLVKMMPTPTLLLIAYLLHVIVYALHFRVCLIPTGLHRTVRQSHNNGWRVSKYLSGFTPFLHVLSGY